MLIESFFKFLMILNVRTKKNPIFLKVMLPILILRLQTCLSMQNISANVTSSQCDPFSQKKSISEALRLNRKHLEGIYARHLL